jgi:hypothetical protein
MSTGDAPRGDGSVTLTLISCPPGGVPTMSLSGLLALVLLMAIGGMAVLRRRSRSAG